MLKIQKGKFCKALRFKHFTNVGSQQEFGISFMKDINENLSINGNATSCGQDSAYTGTAISSHKYMFFRQTCFLFDQMIRGVKRLILLSIKFVLWADLYSQLPELWPMYYSQVKQILSASTVIKSEGGAGRGGVKVIWRMLDRNV